MFVPSCVIALTCGVGLFGLQQASAQSVELFTGVTVGKMRPESEANQATLKGWSTSVTAYPKSRFGLTADLAGFYGSTGVEAVNVSQHSFLAGPQIRLFRSTRLETSFKALVGGAYGQVPSYHVRETTFAALFGSNFDVNVSSRVAIRLSPGLYLTQFGSQTQKSFRFSIGPVFRFGGSPE